MKKRFARGLSRLPSNCLVCNLHHSLRSLFLIAAIGFLLCISNNPTALAQGSKRAPANDTADAMASSGKDKDDKDKDRPDLRDRWMMRGRSAPAGQSATALRLRAHQQKMLMRDAAARRLGASQVTTAARNIRSAAPKIAPEGSLSGTPWVALGPAPLVSDQNLYGAVAGRTTAVAVDPTDATGNTVYVAAASGGVWKSTNAANATASSATWTALTDQQASLVNGAVSVKPDGSAVLVGTGEPDSAIDSYYGVGVLRSTDHGTTWTLIPAATGNNPALSFAGLGFAKFAWAATPATSVVAATGTTTKGFSEGDITNATNRGLYYSPDAGQTWTFEIPQDAGVAISPVSISATDVVYNAATGMFFAAIRFHGLYSSTNGQTWTRLANQPNASQLSAANCPSVVPAGGSSCPIYRGQLAVVPGRNEMYFWFVNLTSGSDGVDVVDEGIWRSLDGGNSWVQIDETGIASCGDPGNNGCGVDQGYYNLEIAALPDGQATDLYAGAVNLFKCQLTGGTTCATLDANFPNQWINLTHVYGCSSIAGVHPDEHGLDFALLGNPPNQAILYFANDGGIYRASNGYNLASGTCGTTNSFDNLNASSVAGGTIGSLTQFVSFSLHPTDQNTVLGGTQDNGSPGTSAATENAQWTTVNGGDGGYNAIDPGAPMQWYTSNPYVNIYTCANGINCTTDTFSPTVSSGEVGGDVGAFYTPYILDPQNPGEMLVGTCRVWRGAPTVPPSSLTAISVDFDTLGASTCTGDEINLVSGLAEGGPTAGGFSTAVYATTEGTGPNAATPSGGEVWATTNAGVAAMADVTGAINPSNYTISSLALDSSDATGATAYVGIMGFNVSHVFKTTNAGVNWSDWSGSGGTALPSAPVNALLVDSTTGTVYAGTDVGVFASSTSSASWTEVGNPSLPGASGYLPNVPVTSIRIFDSGGVKKLRVSTYGRGIWEYALPTSPTYSNVILDTPQTIYAGQTATFEGTLTTYLGYASAVNLSCAGATVPATCTLNPTQTTPLPTGTLYMLTAGGVAGDYNFDVHGVGADPQEITQNAPVTLHVVDFNVSQPNPDALTVEQGNTTTATFSVSAEGSFSGTVTLSCQSGMPAGTTCQCSPASVTPTASQSVPVTMTVTAAPNAPTGGPTTATLSATVAGAPTAKTQTFTVTVTVPPPDFALTLTASPSATVVGQDVTWNGTLTALHGYSGTVNLSCVGSVPGVCSANPSSLTPTANGAAFAVTVGSASAGTFNFSIQGTDGTLTHTQAVGLTVGTDVTWTDTGNSSATVLAGQSATYMFSAAPAGEGAFTGGVTFGCSNLPALTSCNFNPASIAAGAGTTPVTLTITTTGPNTMPGLRKAISSTGSIPSERASYLSLGPAFNTISRRSMPLAGLLTGLWTIPLAGLLALGVGRLPLGISECIWVVGFASLVLLAGCGALGGAGSGPQSITVSVNPANTSVALGGQQQFGATVNNSNNQNVTWAVTGSPTTGSISATGLYTAPGIMPASSTVTVTATSTLATSPGTATVTLTGSGVTVTVSPPTVNLFANEAGNSWPASATQQQFSATVNNGSSQSVTWAVVGGIANGTIEASGLYTTPATVPNPATVTVTASSTEAASPGSSTVNVEAASPIGTFSNIQVTATAAGGPAHTDVVTLTVD